jgi:hypothetical protein
MNNSPYFIFICAALVTICLSCSKDKVPVLIDPNCADNVSFSQDVWPIISENCAGCHGVGNSTGYVFTNHTTVSLNANAIVGSMRNEGFQLMPIGGPALPDSLIQKINCWIQQGAPNN